MHDNLPRPIAFPSIRMPDGLEALQSGNLRLGRIFYNRWTNLLHQKRNHGKLVFGFFGGISGFRWVTQVVRHGFRIHPPFLVPCVSIAPFGLLCVLGTRAVWRQGAGPSRGVPRRRAALEGGGVGGRGEIWDFPQGPKKSEAPAAEPPEFEGKPTQFQARAPVGIWKNAESSPSLWVHWLETSLKGVTPRA